MVLKYEFHVMMVCQLNHNVRQRFRFICNISIIIYAHILIYYFPKILLTHMETFVSTLAYLGYDMEWSEINIIDNNFVGISIHTPLLEHFGKQLNREFWVF